MMFSSNQIFQISGDLGIKGDLQSSLEFALKKAGDYEHFTRRDNPSKCVYQIGADGAYYLGWNLYKETEKTGWTEFPFDFDVVIIASIIEQHLKKQTSININDSDLRGDGSTHKGFLLTDVPYNSPIENSFYGIIKIVPFECYYAK